MASRAARLAELRALRASGKTRLATYEVDDVEKIYEEVNEEDYKKVVRKRLDDDDFVVDDNGQGYADDGREDWQNDPQDEYSESEEEAPARSKAAKRKREEDEEKKQKIANGINRYFSAKAGAAPPKPKPIKTADDDAFMNDLLGEVDVNALPRRLAPRMKPIKDESRRKTRVLSPPLPDSKPTNSRGLTANTNEQLNTPQSHDMYEHDDGFRPLGDDVFMSDPLPSSPVAKAVERKTQPTIKVEEEEEEEDDLMEVTQAVGHANTAASVNMTASKPPPKIKQEAYPTPVSSSPLGSSNNTIDASRWNSVTDKLNVLSSPTAPQTSSVGKLKPQNALEDGGNLRMFWMDYTEINGSLCLFGKVKDKTTGNFVSCFVKVDNIMRKLYFLPREFKKHHQRDTDEEVNMQDVYEEVSVLMSRMKVGTFKIKPISMKYAFELPDVPREADYLNLLYPYDKPALPMDVSGNTFSRAFGTNTALFEQFVLDKNIMGPCWINIQGGDFQAVNNASWCKLELQVVEPKLITPVSESENLDAPPLSLMSIALRTTYNAKENRQEILIASARFYDNVSLTDTTPAEKLPCKTFTIMRPAADSFPTGFKLEVDKHKGMIGLERNEGALLSKFMAIFAQMDPDVLIGHKLDDVDFSILLNRMKEKKTPAWHRIGRLRRSEWPKTMGRGGGSFFAERQLAAGRLLCDLANDLGKSLMTKCQSWSLNEMCELVLGGCGARSEFDVEAALKTWATTREGLMNFVRHCEADTYFIAAIALKVQMLPLTKVLTNLAGNSWARTLSGTRAERNEYILLHEFTRNGYIVPDKVHGKSKPKDEDVEDGEENPDAKKKDKYKGGLVFEPEKGLYDKFILVMDFNSLYPSIIQEFNICFTTVERSGVSEDDERVPEVPTEQELGILPRLISTLVKRRREVKKLMKDKAATPDQIATWDIKQMALKLTANSMYGCLGYIRSRFYARPLAMLTTAKGREILRSTKDLAESHMLRVVYGDTDSVMINTNMDNIEAALKVGNDFKKSVNERYRLLEIDIDNVFRRLLLHAKKKYAAINMVELDGRFVEKLEVKGLDMRRREYCQLSKDTSSKLLNFLLSGEDPDAVVEKVHEHLRQLATQMREFSIPAQKYIIYTQLGKDPKEYPNANSMPSVQVALRLISKGKHVKAKDVMSFIITGTSNGSAETAAKNAFPVDEVLRSELKPDIDYYLHKQILPPVERLCAPISGTNVTHLAECLGLDTSKYRVSSMTNGTNQDNEIQPLESQIPDSVRFKDTTPLSLCCRSCKAVFLFRGLLPSRSGSSEEKELQACVGHEGLTCPQENCNALLPNLTVVAQVEAQIRQHIAKYYAGWLVCDDPSCGMRTRQMSVYGHRCLGPKGTGLGCLGRMHFQYTEKMLYNQLLYFCGLFDVDKAKKEAEKMASSSDGSDKKEKIRVLAEVNRERFGTVRDVVRAYLERNGRQWVQMDSLFAFALKVM